MAYLTYTNFNMIKKQLEPKETCFRTFLKDKFCEPTMTSSGTQVYTKAVCSAGLSKQIS